MFGSILGDPSLGSGVSLIASWDNGYECVATKGSVAAINIFVADAGFWTGDVPLLLANAANFVGAGGINQMYHGYQKIQLMVPYQQATVKM